MAAYTTIDNPELYFQVKTYSGDGSAQSITLDGSEDMAIDLYWGKRRNSSAEHEIYDTARGVTKYMSSNDDDGEQTNTNGLSVFGSNGFTLAGNSSINNGSIVAWCWKESTTAGFDIVTYTGNGSGPRGISHSLSAVPHCFIVKGLASSRSWPVYHHALGNTKYAGYLDSAGASGTYEPFWGDTTPTSSVFTVDTDSAVNANTESYIAYVWSEKQGFSKFGSYTGNGNADGTFVYTGFRPAWIMFKNASAGSSNWQIYDNKREGYNGQNDLFRANSSNAEGDGTDPIDILSNGFKQLNTAASNNVSGETYTYIAFAEAPFVNSNGVPCNAR